MLRHACGYKLANDGQDTRAVQHYLGHKNKTRPRVRRPRSDTEPGASPHALGSGYLDIGLVGLMLGIERVEFDLMIEVYRKGGQ
jgi:hypothetical protein